MTYLDRLEAELTEHDIPPKIGAPIARLIAELRAARLAALEQPAVTGEMVTRDMVAAAMQEAWDEFCRDTGCFPDCFTVARGPKLWANFQISSFALMVTDQIKAALQVRASSAKTGDDSASDGQRVEAPALNEALPKATSKGYQRGYRAGAEDMRSQCSNAIIIAYRTIRALRLDPQS